MALPAIAPYPMPGAADLPEGRAPWIADPKRAALLIHDMQEHFVGAFQRDQEPVPALIANISALRDRAHALGIPVIYSAQPPGQSRAQRGLLQDFWGDGISADPADAAIIAELTPAAGDIQLTKWRYSAFVKTNLHDELRAYGRDQLIITGIYAHIGCLMTAAQAFMEEVEPFLVADALADFSRADHDQALGWAARRCAATLTTETLLSRLEGADSISANEASAGMDAPSPAPLSAAEVRARLAVLTDEPLDDFTDEDDLSDAGIDSIRLMGVITEWQQAGYAVTFEELAEEPTIAAWTTLLARGAASVASAR
ncbi:MAG: isochorismatase family protein [Solirubrobacteraceae bacterium]|nr:isochorismatase family protein [Solirubrobacteraceae bacterium]